jgi:hypothetical protein
MYPTGEYCLSDRGRRDVLVNLELLRVYGAANQKVIEEYNKTIGK